MNPLCVLYVSGGSLDRGGIASWMLNYAARFNRERVAVDFLVHGLEPGAREAEAISLGAKVVHVPFRRNDPAGNEAGIRSCIGLGYDIVHAHMDGMNAYPLGIAKQLGVPVRISHCHNTDFLTQNPIRRAAHELARLQIPTVATHLLACSADAGQFLYGNKRVQAGEVTIVRNAIDGARYRFDEAARNRIRAELGLQERFVIGHIGRFDLHQKNQLFLLEAFAKAKKERSDLALVLVGDGEDRLKIEEQIARSGLKEDVILTGLREDIPALLSAFDLFALPSRFEGLGIVLIEAQASGLGCLASNAVPRDTKIVDCDYLPVNDSARWAEAFCRASVKQERDWPEQALTEQGYEIASAAVQLQEYYERVAGRL